MPTYEYGCTVCGRVTEVMHGVHGTGPERCEHCGGAMRKLITAPAIHFKGSGWAGKDARDSVRSRSASTATSDAKSDSGDKKTSGDEAKPAPAASSDKSEAPSGTSKGSTDAAPAKSRAGKPA
jgi:putative FmdB family regulatory protein